MPQLDFFSISNQFFWGILYFLFFYIIVELYVVPTLFVSIFAREYFAKGGSIDSFDAVHYSFIAFSLFSQHVSDFADINATLLADLEGTQVDISYVFEEVVNTEINKFNFEAYIFEEIDSN